MAEFGFIRDMFDVKFLILFVMANSEYPLSLQKIYELSFQDDRLSYFDLSIAVPEMVETGHLEKLGQDLYQITQKGREAEELGRDALAFPVMERAKAAVEKNNLKMRRESNIQASSYRDSTGWSAKLTINDENGSLMRLEIPAPDAKQAQFLEKAMREKAGTLYRMIIKELLQK